MILQINRKPGEEFWFTVNALVNAHGVMEKLSRMETGSQVACTTQSVVCFLGGIL